MRLAGLQKLTLLDYPGEVACTVFTQGCNLRCPFCQNPALVLPQLAEESGLLPEDEFFGFLARRRGRLTGVAITGGEPTIHEDLPDFIRRIREMGYLVKLDTNGLRPDALRTILEAGLVDYIAMDVKNSPSRYAMTCGCAGEQIQKDATGTDQAQKQPAQRGNAAGQGQAGASAQDGLWERARESIDILKESAVPCEFRTTVALGLHTEEEIREIAACLAGPRPWYLQQFVAGDHLVGSYFEGAAELKTPSFEELDRMRKAALEVKPSVFLRGI